MDNHTIRPPEPEPRADVLVIGAGIAGLCAAYYLAQQGCQVTVVEKGEVGSGSSYGNAGLIVPSHCLPLAEPGILVQGLRWLLRPDSPFYIKPRWDPQLWSWLWKFRGSCDRRRVRQALPIIRDLQMASRSLYQELAGLDGMDCGFEERGLLHLFNTESGLQAGSEEARLMQELGLEAHTLDAAGILELEPQVRTHAVGGIFYPQDAHLNPARFASGLARYLERVGVTIQTDTEVLGWEISGRRLSAVRTTRGDRVAREVVLAGGAWSPAIARDLGIRLPMQPAKGYSVTFQPPNPCPALPLILAEARVAVTPLGDALRLAGTLELAGFDLSINPRRVDAILRAVPRYLPQLDPARLEVIEIWRGLRPCTPDGLPYLGRSRRYDNLTIAAGHATIGVSLGPITGQLVAELITGKEPSVELAALDVERFG